MDDRIKEEPKPSRQPYEYEEPSLIDLDDLEGVTGGRMINITGEGAGIWPKNDWNDDF